jgi:hypothetical protein
MKRSLATLWVIGLLIIAITLSTAYAFRNTPASVTARGQAAIDYAAASAIRSDTLMSWALVAVMLLAIVIVLVELVGVIVAVVWLLRGRWQQDEQIQRKSTVTRES